MSPSSAALSRMISHALRHEPWAYYLELDADGWADLGQLVNAIHLQGPAWSRVHRGDVEEMINSSAKGRHEIDGNRIRARYGHSVPGRITKVCAHPPIRLFHGTALDKIPAIEQQGLRPMRRHYVHLSIDVKTAQAVGERKAPRPIVLEVDTGRAHDAGVAFYEGDESVWLADEIPPGFIDCRAGYGSSKG